jgi:hypothetical protein
MVPDHDRAQKVVPDHDRAWPLVPDHNSACCWYQIATGMLFWYRMRLVPDSDNNSLGTGTGWLSWYRNARHLEVKDSHMTNRALVHEIFNSLTQ